MGKELHSNSAKTAQLDGNPFPLPEASPPKVAFNYPFHQLLPEASPPKV
jgi:hypothetical protein